MARDHARLRIDMWNDEDYRRLTMPAQWLYEHLLTSVTLSFAGVADWRPARIAAHARLLDAATVDLAGDELEEGRFILRDVETEEVLIRSFAKHDGILASLNISKAMARDYALIASLTLRAVLVGQLLDYREAMPDVSGWGALADILERDSMTFEEGLLESSRNPS